MANFVFHLLKPLQISLYSQTFNVMAPVYMATGTDTGLISNLLKQFKTNLNINLLLNVPILKRFKLFSCWSCFDHNFQKRCF